MAISLSPKEKQLLRKVNIPLRPDSLQKITDEIKLAEPSIDNVIEIIKKDISLSAAVLKVANSAAFRRAKAFTSINQAVMVLGLKRIEVIVSSVALRQSLGQTDDLVTYWHQCNMTADLIAILCEIQKLESLVDPAYMLGLFHVSGIPVLLNTYDNYKRFMKEAEDLGWSEIVGKEKVNFGTTHTTISAVLASRWKLPKALVEVIYHLHDAAVFESKTLNPVALRLLCFLKLARNIMHQRTGKETDTSEWMNAELHIKRHLKLTQEDMVNLRQQVTETYIERQEV